MDVIDLTDQDYLKVSNAILGVRGTLRVFTSGLVVATLKVKDL